MIDLGTDFPDSEDFIEGVGRSMAVIRDELSNIEQLIKQAVEGNVYITSEDVANILHCEVENIPSKIIKYRIGRDYIYKKSEVIAYIESRKVGGK